MVPQFLIVHPEDPPSEITDDKMMLIYQRNLPKEKDATSIEQDRPKIKGNEVTKTNQNFVNWFYSWVAFALYFDLLGPCTTTPKKWLVTSEADKKRINFNRNLLIKFLRDYCPMLAQKWFDAPGKRNPYDDVKSIITFRTTIKARARNAGMTDRFPPEAMRVPRLWIHHFFFTIPVMSEHNLIAEGHEERRKVYYTAKFTNDDRRLKFPSWNGKFIPYQPSDSEDFESNEEDGGDEDSLDKGNSSGGEDDDGVEAAVEKGNSSGGEDSSGGNSDADE